MARTTRPRFRAGPVRVRVPASSANLGPAFDAAGLALALYDDVVVAVDDAGLDVQVAGEGASGLPLDESHLVVRALRAGFDALGGQPRGLALRCANRIPHGRGLGSSSAAIVAGLVAARALVVGGRRDWSDADLLVLADQMEGHADNVAAALLGGFTLAWRDDVGAARAVRAGGADGVVPVLFVAADHLSTTTARGLLPRRVPFADASATAGRAALLVVALGGRADLLAVATAEWLHQGARAPAMPATAHLVQRLRDGGVAAVVSGAGPSVLALTTAARAREVADLQAPGFVTLQPGVDLGGARTLAVRTGTDLTAVSP